MSATLTRLVARLSALPVPSGSCPSLDWLWSVRPWLPTPPCQPPPLSPPCPRYDISSSYFDKGREAGNGDGTGRDMGSLKNGYGPGLERGGCHPLTTTGRNKTSLSTFPPTKAPPLQQTPPSRCRCCCERSWLIPRRHLHHLFYFFLLLLPCVTHAATGLSRVSSPLHPSRRFPDPQTDRSLARSLAWACFKRKGRQTPSSTCLLVCICCLCVCCACASVRECV